MTPPDDEALAAALDEYLSQLQAGQKPDRAGLLAKHPDAAGLLASIEALNSISPSADTTPSPSASPPKPAPPPAPEFGRYELLEEIGRGGMGVVYKARQKDLDRIVAVKVILAGQLASPEHVRRFDAESKAAARLHHPNIIRVHEAGEILGQHYFAMEYVAGSSLAGRIKDAPMPLDSAIRLLCTVSRAVDYLHSQGIVHRDLKPSNILLDENDQPYVTDFGLVKLMEPHSQATQSGMIAGSPSYMSPEQAAGRVSEVSPRSDVYSLGTILYELLTGQPPFRSETPLDTLVQVLESEPPLPRDLNPKVPRALELICLRCLEKSAENRYGSAAALADDLERFLKGEIVEAQPLGVWHRLQRWTRREPALSSRLAGLLICAGVAQLRYSMAHSVSLTLHLQVMGTIGLWIAVSALCQWCLRHNRWSDLIRYVWSAADLLLMSGILKIDDALVSPLIIGYAMMITASGLWFHVRLVAFTTAVAVASYGALVFDSYRRGEGLNEWNWHFIFVAVLIIIGFIVAYQVRRVRALSRFYEGRPL